MNNRWTIALGCWVLGLSQMTQASPEKPVAMLTDLSGQVLVGKKPAQLFDAVARAQLLDAGPASRWTLSFIKAGLRVSGNKGRYRVTEEGVEALPGSQAIRQKAAPALTGIALDRSLNWDRMGGIKRTGNLGWRSEEAVEDPTQAIAWECSSEFSQVHIVVEKTPGYERVFKQTLASSAGEILLPLEPATTYQLNLKGLRADGSQEEASPLTLRVLSAQEKETLLNLEKNEDLVELCFFQMQLGFYRRAAQLAQKLLARHPDQEKLKTIIRFQTHKP